MVDDSRRCVGWKRREERLDAYYVESRVSAK